jgi:hypothetical protein
MNERIKQLADEATVWQDANHGYIFDKEKFAELILSESAAQIDRLKKEIEELRELLKSK